MSAQVVLAARNVAKSYGQVHALKGVNFASIAARSPRSSERTARANPH